MDEVLKISGGSARVVPPRLKRMGFLASDGTPTELYARFRTDSGRSAAALEGLRSAFAEMFRRNEYVHKSSDEKTKDVIVEITGLTKSDPICRSIFGTFSAIKHFIDASKKIEETTQNVTQKNEVESNIHSDTIKNSSNIGLSYHINIVLPETTNIQVFNAIFRSLKENLL
jgi:hypothetical protein